MKHEAPGLLCSSPRWWCPLRGTALKGWWWGHEATDTGLAYAPVSQAHGHHHTQFNVLPCCTAAQTSSVPIVALRLPLQVAIAGGGGGGGGVDKTKCGL